MIARIPLAQFSVNLLQNRAITLEQISIKYPPHRVCFSTRNSRSTFCGAVYLIVADLKFYGLQFNGKNKHQQSKCTNYITLALNTFSSCNYFLKSVVILVLVTTTYTPPDYVAPWRSETQFGTTFMLQNFINLSRSKLQWGSSRMRCLKIWKTWVQMVCNK